MILGLDLAGVVEAALGYGGSDRAAVQQLAGAAEAGMLEGQRELEPKHD